MEQIHCRWPAYRIQPARRGRRRTTTVFSVALLRTQRRQMDYKPSRSRTEASGDKESRYNLGCARLFFKGGAEGTVK